MNDNSKFLKEVEGMNEKYASIYLNCELESLAMPFWSWEEIRIGWSLRKEWEIEYDDKSQIDNVSFSPDIFEKMNECKKKH